ncbi:hypothetical protein [Lewinella sp. JB7]|uniref:hypothetical protein n=1 Tax=Lewinella sp. JB7 TaxID=2962887 RepID=UPI0020C949E7|nr:hypothetical protein [Lewinella sp. JB7]MCP9236312.1 hypothetical protein [Lewinella sp. JB7]
MRPLVLLFALYLAFLAVLPCADGAPVVVQGDAEFRAGAVLDHPNCPEPGHDDHCTPFCTCVCCGATVDAPPGLLAAALLPLPPNGITQPEFNRTWKEAAVTDGDGQPPRA